METLIITNIVWVSFCALLLCAAVWIMWRHNKTTQVLLDAHLASDKEIWQLLVKNMVLQQKNAKLQEQLQENTNIIRSIPGWHIQEFPGNGA